jgi:type IV pilus assembly protein PilC
MLFTYKSITTTGEKKDGSIDAASRDLAVTALQRRGLIVTSIKSEDDSRSFFKLSLFESVPLKDVVIMSRQISTLFESQVSALKAFTMLSTNAENKILGRKLAQIAEDLQAGTSISGALEKHPDVFTNFYVNMVRAGEESGKLNQTFTYLADYLDREYALKSKTKNALIYPAFVVVVFFIVMLLMFTMVIPKLSAIILESGQEVPVLTKIVIGVSDFIIHYGIFFGIFLVVAGFFAWTRSKSERGKTNLDGVKLSIPVVGKLYRTMYLSRIADNLDTMLSSGISIVRAIDITGEIVGNKVFEHILKDASESVKAGSSLSDALEKHIQIPGIMIQMVKVGEETGSLSNILRTLSTFYKREVDDAVDTLVGLIEPAMIVFLGLGVGVLLTSILVPIYNIAGGIQ